MSSKLNVKTPGSLSPIPLLEEAGENAQMEVQQTGELPRFCIPSQTSIVDVDVMTMNAAPLSI
eukprot:scaffold12009_cov105-Skeletonema_dohrnii-CCMP3373.AAC.1